ncbi:hypothetical protein EAG_07291 [Camponotus floridanus]|uniref:Uncharacterized protein n=1 Tax=Camponotus floridanus TaxID=104421 RepID=E2A2T4_CAMFO|nr:hypothetical protein EAG_07291 [Camponotus floridanus]
MQWASLLWPSSVIKTGVSLATQSALFCHPSQPPGTPWLPPIHFFHPSIRSYLTVNESEPRKNDVANAWNDRSSVNLPHATNHSVSKWRSINRIPVCSATENLSNNLVGIQNIKQAFEIRWKKV